MAGSHPDLIAAARDAMASLLDSDRRRIVVGIAGPPAAGKSTLSTSLSHALCAEFGPRAAVAVPMDGFHLANAELARLGLADRKGAPETFDAAGFVHLLRRLREPDAETVYAPAFHRARGDAVAGAIPVGPEVRIVVVEGNYLLLPKQPWAPVRDLLDVALYIEAPDAARANSLLRRQRARGLSRAAAHDWVNRSDEANAALIAGTRSYADHVLVRPS